MFVLNFAHKLKKKSNKIRNLANFTAVLSYNNLVMRLFFVASAFFIYIHGICRTILGCCLVQCG